MHTRLPTPPLAKGTLLPVITIFAAAPWLPGQAGEEAAALPPLDLSAWTWSGPAESLEPFDFGLLLDGGAEGEFLEATEAVPAADEWLFLRGSWWADDLSTEAIVLSWDNYVLTLFPTETGWVPALGEVAFHPRFAIGADEAFEAALRIGETGLVDFSWNGELLLEQTPLGNGPEDSLLVTVPPGFVLGLEALEWTPIRIEEASPLESSPGLDLGAANEMEGDAAVVFGAILKPGESLTPPGVEVPAPSGPPPPHPFFAMDGEGRLLDTRGNPREGSGGTLHAGGALVGNGKASPEVGIRPRN